MSTWKQTFSFENAKPFIYLSFLLLHSILSFLKVKNTKKYSFLMQRFNFNELAFFDEKMLHQKNPDQLSYWKHICDDLHSLFLIVPMVMTFTLWALEPYKKNDSSRSLHWSARELRALTAHTVHSQMSCGEGREEECLHHLLDTMDNTMCSSGHQFSKILNRTGSKKGY